MTEAQQEFLNEAFIDSKITLNSAVHLYNICIGPDGHIRSRAGHSNCTGVWKFDGQFFIHQY